MGCGVELPVLFESPEYWACSATVPAPVMETETEQVPPLIEQIGEGSEIIAGPDVCVNVTDPVGW
jgi:hypothetical protein